MSLKACSIRLFRAPKVSAVEAGAGSRWNIVRQWNYCALGIHVQIVLWGAKDNIQRAGLSLSFPLWSRHHES